MLVWTFELLKLLKNKITFVLFFLARLQLDLLSEHLFFVNGILSLLDVFLIDLIKRVKLHGLLLLDFLRKACVFLVNYRREHRLFVFFFVRLGGLRRIVA